MLDKGQDGERDAISVRSVDSITEMNQIVELQKQIWGYGSEGTDYPYPARALLALCSSGGLVSVAFVGDDPAGFSVAWLGRPRGRGELYLHSQLLGVIPSYRKRGVGFKLKMHQREYALAEGISRIGWTYDPLRATNAYFNLHKLGAVTRRYLQDHYGEMKSVFSAGQTSDRLWADWHIDSDRVLRCLQANTALTIDEGPAYAISSRARGDGELGLRIPLKLDLNHSASRVLVEIPADFDRLRVLDQEAAEAWRGMVRKALCHYLSSGYVADEFLFSSCDSTCTAYYRLSQSETAYQAGSALRKEPQNQP